MVRRSSFSLGFTLPEMLVTVVILVILVLGMYQGYILVQEVARSSRYKTTATLLANERFELLRNLPYGDVGVVGGVPNGIIPFSEVFVRGGISYTVETIVRNVDDPFDGLIGGNPNDLSPADYKLVSLQVLCDACENFEPMVFTARVAPVALETTSGNGALFIEVFDANGQPVSGADVLVENNATSSPISINDVTGANGMLQLVDIPPGVQVWEVSVSKNGYSSAQTYAMGAVGNPNPTKPHATIATGTVTQISFSIDRLADLSIRTRNASCGPIGNISFDMTGSKLIGTNPDVFKYDTSHQTDASGNRFLSDIEWDTYSFSISGGSYYLFGSIPFLPHLVNPGASDEIFLVLTATDPNALLVSVKDSGTALPLSDATATLSSTSTSFSAQVVTGKGYFRQTDWSGGSGQSDFIDPTRFASQDGDIEILDPAGDMRLRKPFSEYVSDGELISSSFDSGTTTTDYFNLSFGPQDQPPETGTDSVRFQIATNNDNTTWNFIGPDGTGSTYYTKENLNLHSSHNNNRYLRYKTFLSTASTTFTPNVSDVSVTYSSECLPFGQAYFDNLASGNYSLMVTHPSYQSVTQDVVITSGWQAWDISLNPNP